MTQPHFDDPTFDDPDEVAGDRLLPSDCVGHLLMVWATGYIEDSPTKYSRPDKKSDVIVVDVVNLDEADEEGYQGKLYLGSWWRQARLIGSLRRRIGKGPVLARMALGVPTMGKPPFELRTAKDDPEAVSRGHAWLAAHPDFKPTPQRAAPVVAVEVRSEEPSPPQKSMLQQIASQQAAALRPARTSLPPVAPARAKQDDDDIPF